MSKDDPLAPQLIRGRCLCGSFQFQIIGPIRRGSTLSLRPLPTRQRNSFFCQRENFT